MAAIRDTPTESHHRSSLLNVVLNRTEALKRKELIHRLVYIGKLKFDQSEKGYLGEYYEKFFKSHNSHAQVEPVTGLLLIYPHNFVHVIEASTHAIMETIKDLDSKQKRGILLKEAKVLLSVGNIPVRLYSQWNYRVLNLPSIRTDETKLAESTENLLSEALALTLKLGYQLSRVSKLSLKTALDQMHDKYRDLLIPEDIIEKVLKSQDLCDPNQYLKRYCTPFEIALDRDLVWPAETKLFPL